MSLVARIGQEGRRILAVLLALISATGMIVLNPTQAHAGNRDWLRPDYSGSCEWDGVGFWVQRCDVWSPSMNRNIPVLIQASSAGGNAGLYLLDGMRATDYTNAMATQTDAPALYADHNITLVMPIGGAASFYADWVGNPTWNSSPGLIYMWETFLTKELPVYLRDQFGVSPNNNAIAGLSMGGTAAVNLAANHPDQFRQTLSYSGYLTMTLPGAYAALGLAMLDVGSFNITQMYGSIIDPRRFMDDPFWNMDSLRNNGVDVYVSAGSGLPAGASTEAPAGQLLAGTLLEVLSRISTQIWEGKARLTGLNPTVDYPSSGVHDWHNWNDQVHKTRDRVLNVMNAW